MRDRECVVEAGARWAAGAMPPMGALLDPRQIRDVVELLVTQ